MRRCARWTRSVGFWASLVDRGPRLKGPAGRRSWCRSRFRQRGRPGSPPPSRPVSSSRRPLATRGRERFMIPQNSPVVHDQRRTPTPVPQAPRRRRARPDLPTPGGPPISAAAVGGRPQATPHPAGRIRGLARPAPIGPGRLQDRRPARGSLRRRPRELWMPTPRRLHTTLAELEGRQACVSPTVTTELAPDGYRYDAIPPNPRDTPRHRPADPATARRGAKGRREPLRRRVD